MIDSLYLAWKYLSFNKARTATIVGCVTLIAVLPLALDLLLGESERQLRARAVTTPLVLGARGSSLDLVMNTLYFGRDVPELVSMAAAEEIIATGLALPIPMDVRFEARNFAIVGTTFDYFDFRGLEIAAGRPLVSLGECVLGSAVAEALDLGPGDSLVSSPETLFDLAGVYPLKMKVVGVLERTHSADDLAIFVDIKTSWVIQGLGHGHQDLSKTTDPSVIIERSADNVVANAKLLHYNEITEDNVDSFHFHGDPETYPATAVISVPLDTRSGTILRGRYLGQEARYQIVPPDEVIDGLLENIFRIKNMIDAIILVVGAATMVALVLVFSLSLRLRQREMQTIFRLGCARLTTARLLIAEILLLLAIAAALCAAILLLVDAYSTGVVRAVVIR